MDLEITACGVSCNGYIACAADIFIVSVLAGRTESDCGDCGDLCGVYFCGRSYIRKAYKSKTICMGLDAWGCLFCIAAFDIAWDIQGD